VFEFKRKEKVREKKRKKQKAFLEGKKKFVCENST